jgi:ABC-type antimicrobial peptide transport system permease subunit
VVGIYAANSVGERTRELGIRVALGSSTWQAMRDAVSPGLRWTLGGALLLAIAAGLAALVPAIRIARLNPAETLRSE